MEIIAEGSEGTILLVDDDEDMLAVIAAHLRDWGFRPITAASGEDAFEKFGKQDFVLVITDCMMPGMTGLELALLIAQLDGPPVIIESGDSDIADRVKAAGVHATCLTKPVDPDVLRATIDGMLHSSAIH